MTPETIRAVRGALGLSAEEFGEAAGVAGRTVRRWEAGTDNPSQEAVERILRLEQSVRQHVAYIDELLVEHGVANMALIRYRRIEDMLPERRPPGPIGLYHAGLAALRFKYGAELAIVDWDEASYRAWLGGREDRREKRGEWAARRAKPPGAS